MAGMARVLAAAALAALLALPSGAAGSTIKVTRTSDELDGAPDDGCSLREAIRRRARTRRRGLQGRARPTADTIRLGKHEYTLTIPTTDESLNANGDLDFKGGGAATILGKGLAKTRVTTALADRVLESGTPAGSLTLRGLTLAGGDATGLAAGNDRGGVIRAESGGHLDARPGPRCTTAPPSSAAGSTPRCRDR